MPIAPEQAKAFAAKMLSEGVPHCIVGAYLDHEAAELLRGKCRACAAAQIKVRVNVTTDPRGQRDGSK